MNPADILAIVDCSTKEGGISELHDQVSSLLSHWERSGEGACISAKLEKAIKANLKGLGYGL